MSDSREQAVRFVIDDARRHGPIPAYGSDEFDRLPDYDPRRFAALVIAAENWRRDGTDDAIRERLERELLEADMFVMHRIRQASLDVSSGPMPKPRTASQRQMDTYEGRLAWFEQNATKKVAA